MSHLFIPLAFAVVVLAVVAFVRWRFIAEIAAIEKAVTASPLGSGRSGPLPPEVRALAARHGAREGGQKTAQFQQAGSMWSRPGAKAMPFRARQVSAAIDSAFVWRAEFQPLGAIIAADYLTKGEAGLKVKLLGVIPLVNVVWSPEVRRGQLLRYLAELPWVPDAMLLNPAVDWRVEGPDRLVAGSGEGADRVEVTFMLGEDGLIASAECAARPRLEGGQTRDRPWGGRFSEYREIEGRMIPTRAEAHWLIDGQRFVYWAGYVDRWTMREI